MNSTVDRPLLFLDLDDVLCLNAPYGCYDVASKPWPNDLMKRLWHRPALDVLQGVVEAFQPNVVVTSAWLRLMELSSIAALFRMSDAAWLASALHRDGEALQMSGRSRLDAVDAWLAANHHGEPYVILDDTLSGTGLAGSAHDRQGRVVLCDVGVGLLPEHAERIRLALSTTWRTRRSTRPRASR